MDHWKHTINNDHQIALELCGIRAVRASPAAYVPARVFALRLYAPPARPRVPPCAGVGSAPIVSRLALVLLAGQLEKERNAAFSTAISKEKGSILVLIRNALWLGTEMVAANKSVSLANHVMAIKGGGVSTTYRTDMMCAEMQGCIASVIRKRRLQQVAQSPFFGVTIDEGTDIGWEHVLIIYLSYVDSATGKVVVCFHALIELLAKDAATIFDALSDEITEVSGLPFPKWASTGYDGASVMTGELSGVGVRLCKRQPYAVNHHDVAHKLNLAASNANETTKDERPTLDAGEQNMHMVTTMHGNSCGGVKGLGEMQAVYMSKQRLHHGTITRWLTLSRMGRGCYESIPACMAKGSKDKDTLLLKTVSEPAYILVCAFFADYTEKLAKLSKVLQKDHIKYSVAQEHVASTKVGLRASYLGGGEVLGGKRLGEWQTSLRDALNGDELELGPFKSQLGALNSSKDLSLPLQLPFDAAEYRSTLHPEMVSLAEELIANLDGRFPKDPFMEAFDALYPSSMPACSNPADATGALQSLMAWGVEKLATLAGFYCTDRTLHETGVTFKAPLDAPKLKDEYETFKTLLVLEREKGPVEDDVFWAYILTKKAKVLPNMAKLITLLLVQALTSSCCERGLSTLGLIKTKLRNSLLVQTCGNLMEITLNGPELTAKNEAEVASVLDEAFELWASRKARNPNKAHFVKRPRKSRFVSRPLLDELADGYNSDVGADAAEAEAEAEAELVVDEETEVEAAGRAAAELAVFNIAPALAIPPGMTLLEWPPKMTAAGMRGVKIMHVFSSGWWSGTWRGNKTKGGFWKVYYADDIGARTGHDWEQSLLREDYGHDKKWVAIRRATKQDGKKASVPALLEVWAEPVAGPSPAGSSSAGPSSCNTHKLKKKLTSDSDSD